MRRRVRPVAAPWSVAGPQGLQRSRISGGSRGRTRRCSRPRGHTLIPPAEHPEPPRLLSLVVRRRRRGPVFSYIDLVRVEIAMEVGERFGVAIPDEETDRWRSLGDVARSVVARASGAASEAEIFGWV